MVATQVDRRGARLRAVNPQAVQYALRAGLRLEDVYPGGMLKVRRIAPAPGTTDAARFVEVTGLDVYPQWAGEAAGRPLARAARPPRRFGRWRWALLGGLVGAALGGPLGAGTLGLLGVVAGAR